MNPQDTCCAPTCCAPATPTHTTPSLDAEEAPDAAPRRSPADAQREAVRTAYAAVARGAAPSCGGASTALGYAPADLLTLPEGVDLGLGCGNPTALAGLQPGETALDLGCGPGMDCVLAARRVGPTGRVIGVDMTPEMVSRARAATADLGQVSIRLGEIEHLPVADASVDVVLSNCVINLSPEKRAVYAEAMRVLRPGGRLAIADVVLLKPLPEALASRWEALSGCVAGAATAEQVEGWLRELGFEAIAVTPQPSSRAVIASWLPGSGAEDYVASATISAVRPTAAAA